MTEEAREQQHHGDEREPRDGRQHERVDEDRHGQEDRQAEQVGAPRETAPEHDPAREHVGERDQRREREEPGGLHLDGAPERELRRGREREPERQEPREVRAVGADYAGVDIIQERAGRYLVLEVNSMPAWRALQTATGADIAGLLASHVLSKVATAQGRRPPAAKRSLAR